MKGRNYCGFCGFAAYLSEGAIPKCPVCGTRMTPVEWIDEGAYLPKVKPETYKIVNGEPVINYE